MLKLEYIYEGDGDIFVDYSWERAILIDNEIYPEWVLEFFSTLYFDKDVDRKNLMKEKCIWFRLYGHEHILTLPEFAFVDDKQFDHKDYWTRVGKPTLTNHKEVLVKEPLMRIVHKVIVGSLVHRLGSLYKDAPGSKENSVICVGHYVTKIAYFLGYCVDDEIKKCSELIDCNFAHPTYEPPNVPPYQYPYIPYPYPYTHYPKSGNQSNQGGSYGLGGDGYFTSAMPDFGGSSSGYAVGGSSRGAEFNDDDDMDE
ncbi:hypothetical protein Tco_0888872 [Tanacetum coccineum]